MILLIYLIIYLFILIYTVELIRLLIERSKQDETILETNQKRTR